MSPFNFRSVSWLCADKGLILYRNYSLSNCVCNYFSSDIKFYWNRTFIYLRQILICNPNTVTHLFAWLIRQIGDYLRQYYCAPTKNTRMASFGKYMGCLFSFLSIIFIGYLHCLLLGAWHPEIAKPIGQQLFLCDVYLPGVDRRRALTIGTEKTNVVTLLCAIKLIWLSSSFPLLTTKLWQSEQRMPLEINTMELSKSTNVLVHWKNHFKVLRGLNNL